MVSLFGMEDFCLSLLSFCEQKIPLETLLRHDRQPSESDRPFTDIAFPLPETMYRNCGHPRYDDRWKAAVDLRDKAINLYAREWESSWNDLLTKFVFQNICDQASE